MAEALSFQPSDQVQRDRILTDLDITLFVEAGAGTGKTSSLVGRIIEAGGDGPGRNETHRGDHLHREGRGRTA